MESIFGKLWIRGSGTRPSSPLWCEKCTSPSPLLIHTSAPAKSWMYTFALNHYQFNLQCLALRSNGHQMRLLCEASLSLKRWPYRGRASEHLGWGKAQAAPRAYLAAPALFSLSMLWGDGVQLLVLASLRVNAKFSTSCTDRRMTRLLFKSVDWIYCFNPYLKKKWVSSNITDVLQAQPSLQLIQREKVQHFWTLTTEQPCRWIKQNTVPIRRLG